jgi:hypothetical protein
MLLIGSSTLDYLDLADDSAGRRGAASAAAKSVREEAAPVTVPLPSQSGPTGTSAAAGTARRP